MPVCRRSAAAGSEKRGARSEEREARSEKREASLAAAGGNKADGADSIQSLATPTRSQDDLMEILEQGKAAITKTWDIALVPFHAVLSKPAQKAYLGTFLLATTSLFLLVLSTIAYALFYFNYVPQVSVERTIHLQFGDGHPNGVATLGSSLAALQAYQVSLLLHLPRTPNNQAAGNFMLDLSLLSPAKVPSTAEKLLPESARKQRLAHSRRPAILTYASPLIDTASTLTGLPWYVLGWKTESEVVEVSMFEGVEFPKGWTNVPQEVKLVVEATEKMQFYEVGIRIFAKFGGLRWIMYHHRILSYLIFTTMFWSSSMFSALVAWLVLSSYIASDATEVKKEDQTPRKIKAEPSESERYEPSLTEGLSDTSRTFPTLGRHIPLHFAGREESARRGSNEGEKQVDEVIQSTGLQPLIAEADDEDEGIEISGFRDSGIGTSLDEIQRGRVQRRKKHSLVAKLPEEL
ncbi:MAG: hypothetical protein L6R36_006966 [Xanthoria steineri]|nr:MAG: hypothetical protein L6R36_006966 [Xanthoria steineri]